MYLQHIDRHLEGEAAQWVLNTPSVRALVYKGYMDLATGSDIDAFHDALSERFKLTLEEVTAMKKPFPALDILGLEQRASEGLHQYYSRARDLLLSLHGRDDDNDALTSQEVSLRGIVVARFVTGLRDDWPTSDRRLLFRMLQQQIVHPTRTLYSAFRMAEVESKKLDLEKEQQEKEKESKDREQKEQQEREKEHEKKRKLATKQQQSQPRSTRSRPRPITVSRASRRILLTYFEEHTLNRNYCHRVSTNRRQRDEVRLGVKSSL